MILNGRIGQVCGPFDSSDLLAPGGVISNQTPEVTKPILIKLGVQAPKGTIIKLNGLNVKIGATGIYELDNIVAVKSLIFPNGAPEEVIVDYVY